MCSSLWFRPIPRCKNAAARQLWAGKWQIYINQKQKLAFPQIMVSFFHETVSFVPEKEVIGA
jgi:hypothetical protein